MKKIILISLINFFVTLTIQAQNVDIPDALFKSKLLSNSNINYDDDGEISVEEATNYTGKLDVSGSYGSPLPDSKIKSLQGIEAFVNISQLSCAYNEITSLDLTKNTLINILNCVDNDLVSLNLSNNSNIENLYCSYNHLESLTLGSNTTLLWLDCTGNRLTNLNVSLNMGLAYLYCNENLISNLDLSYNSLTYVDCSYNELTRLNLSYNNYLDGMTCQNNPNLSSICISSSQVGLSNNKSKWKKDATATYTTNCTITGIDESVQSSNTEVLNIYNLQGIEVSKTYQGLVIYTFADGTSEKVFQK